MARLGLIGDTHEPFCHPMYRRFCIDTFNKFKVNKIHHVGDVVDNHAINFHEHDPNGHSAGDETALARKAVQRWVASFPEATVSVGNHDELHYRQAKANGTPTCFLKTYREVWGTPKWKWDYEHEIDGVLLPHGTGTSGKNAAINLAVNRRMSVAMGHIHSWGGVMYHTNPNDRIFGLQVGCGIDIRAYVFAYGRTFPVRPTLGCSVIIDGEFPIFVPMACGRGERYHRSRAGKKRRAR